MVSQLKHLEVSLDTSKFPTAEQLALLPELLEATVSDDLNSSTTSLGLKTPHYLTDGSRDEMNLAEFPLAVLSSRSNPNIKTLEFSDTQRLKTGEIIERKWTITAADKFGLPTSTDDDVVLGLMQLTKNQGFRNRKIYFTRYELLKALRWSTEGRSYGRLAKSLDRLSGVRIKAANAFYDNSAKTYQTVNFGLIDAYEINDSRGGSDHEQPKSFFIWSEKLFDSFKSGFIKKLDLDLYFSLRSAISRRMYRYLDKHTYYRSSIDRHLMSFAFDKLGLSRTYKFVSSIKQQIEPACLELKSVGFLDEYEFIGSGKDSYVRFTVTRDAASKNLTRGSLAQNTAEKTSYRAQTGSSSESKNEPRSGAEEGRMTVGNVNASAAVKSSVSDSTIRDALVSRGMTIGQVERLLQGKSSEELARIKLIIEHFDNRIVASNQKGIARNPIGLLYRAVESPFTFLLPNEAQRENKFHNASVAVRGKVEDLRSSSSRGNRSLRPELKVVRAETLGKEKQNPVRRSGDDQKESFRAYERFLDLEIAKVKASMCASELTDLYSKVQQKMSCLSSVLSAESLRESVARCFEEEIRKLAKIPDFRSWLRGEG